MVELSRHQVGQPHPGLAFVLGDRDAAVVPDHHVVGIVGIDPHCVMIDVNVRRAVEPEGLPTVVGNTEGCFRQIDAEIVLRIDPDDAEVHRPAVVAAHFPPAGAGVVGPIDPALLLVLHPGVDDVGVAAIDVEPDPAHRPLGQSLGESGPAPATVGRLPDPAVGAAAVEAEAGPAPLIGGGVDHLVVGGIHHQLGAASIRTGVEHLGPREAAVGGLVDPAVPARPPEVA